jgi:hypothetical protein
VLGALLDVHPLVVDERGHQIAHHERRYDHRVFVEVGETTDAGR